MWRLAIAILYGHRSALALGLPRHVDTVAMEVGKVEQRPAMTSVENGLTDVTCGNTEIDAGQLRTRSVHPTGRGSTSIFLRSWKVVSDTVDMN